MTSVTDRVLDRRDDELSVRRRACCCCCCCCVAEGEQSDFLSASSKSIQELMLYKSTVKVYLNKKWEYKIIGKFSPKKMYTKSSLLLAFPLFFSLLPWIFCSVYLWQKALFKILLLATLSISNIRGQFRISLCKITWTIFTALNAKLKNMQTSSRILTPKRPFAQFWWSFKMSWFMHKPDTTKILSVVDVQKFLDNSSYTSYSNT